MYSSIQNKLGYCIDCNDGKLKPIVAKRCKAFHYKIHRNKIALERRNKRLPELKEQHNELWNFFQECIKKCELRCAECGERIYVKEKTAHWHIAHILKKEFFKSIQTNDFNWLELCWQCHNQYDVYMENHDERLMHMRIFPIVINRIIILYPLITERRKNNLPEFILKQIGDNL